MNQMYARQEALKFIGSTGQGQLLQKTVLVIGLGGTGSAAANLFARLGIKKLIIIDRDIIEISNIHRQLLYDYDDIGKYKAETAFKKIKKINPYLDVEYYNETFDASKAYLVEKSDLVFDGTDNMTTRFIINDACIKFNKPWIFTSAIEMYGEIKAIIPGRTSCYACYNNDPVEMPSCAVSGVLSPVPSAIASMAVTMAVRIMLGGSISGDLYFIDAFNTDITKINIKKNKECRACNYRDFKYLGAYYSNLGKSILS
ncbi:MULTISPECIES: HesA/MoeB/ThiF family protein [Acidiplasma]|uniref:Molybdopterin biosynthesis protein MoeB n=1 Tax=Acidiplasma aeolicum TaxID=507754 RepID=A0A0P9GU01_9ARCH|nr:MULTISPECIES: HesA/MoeB/ThiF family protein [Acidiplasma]KPV44712.1 molybdopterin biosynthesis protein MoeB [Acidiplasma aeolicum]KQB33599.1 molybdopterin biosynthesis protein MoeB [Acidiplasma aeolicum]